jgi:glycine betaine/proline transport system substrate-binding protein
MKQRKPIIIINWTPNWTDTRLTGEFVEFPPYDDLCVTDASWGLNRTLPYDCGNPVSGWVKKVVSPRFEKNHPCAFKALQKSLLPPK